MLNLLMMRFSIVNLKLSKGELNGVDIEVECSGEENENGEIEYY